MSLKMSCKSFLQSLESKTAYPQQHHFCGTFENLCKRVDLVFLWGIRYKTDSTFVFKITTYSFIYKHIFFNLC